MVTLSTKTWRKLWLPSIAQRADVGWWRDWEQHWREMSRFQPCTTQFTLNWSNSKREWVQSTLKKKTNNWKKVKSIFTFDISGLFSRPWARISVVDFWQGSLPRWSLIRLMLSRLPCSYSRHAINIAHVKLSFPYTVAWELKVSFLVWCLV